MVSAKICVSLVPFVNGHGNIVWPRAWWDGGDVNMYSGHSGDNGAAMWFVDNVVIPTTQTQTNAVSNTDPMRTYYDINIHKIDPRYPNYPIDIYTNHAWRAPGTTQVDSPCGSYGGNPYGCWTDTTHTKHEECSDDPGNVAFGPDARDYYGNWTNIPNTRWKAGQQVEVAWQVVANHGGGYSYRLCPRSSELSEECFQAHVLDFVGDKQWFQFGYNRASRAMFGDVPAKRTTKGTHPKGSMWTRNPTPACQGPGSGNANERGGGNQFEYPNAGGTYSCSPDSYKGGSWEGKYSGPQFEPHGGYPGKYAKYGIYTYGFGNNQGQNTGGPLLYSMVDLVQVPKNLKPGQYVLSQRYDCEQTLQVWNSCADITILPADSTESDDALIPDGPAGIDLPPFTLEVEV